ncbi:MAG: hypothetical protein CL843_13600 [Crocinitomicaceae bacterium]|nr:hypothetical protein [Crocinitomicaceae bacterium]
MDSKREMSRNLETLLHEVVKKLSSFSSEEQLEFASKLSNQLNISGGDSSAEYESLLERYNLAILGANDGVWDWDLETNKVYYSKRWNEILGYSNEELLPNEYDSWACHVHPEDFDMAQDPVQRHLNHETEKMEEIVYRMKTKNGSYIYTAHRGVASFDKDGKPVRMVGTMRNVDEEYKNRLELIEQNTFINGILNASPHLIFVKDEFGNFIKVNRALARLFGQSIEEVEHQHGSQLIDKKDELALYDAVESKVLKTLQTISVEERFTDFKGVERIFHTIKTPMRTEDGTLNILGLSTDITHLKEIQNALKEKEKEYRDLVNALSVVVFKTDLDGKWTFLNPAWTNLLGYKVEETIGTNAIDYSYSDDTQYKRERFKALVNKEVEFSNYQLRLKNQKGEPRYFEMFARLAYDTEGNVIGTQGTLVDIHETVIYEEELKTRQAILRTIAENSIDVIAIHETNADYRFISPSIEALLGYKPDELIGKNPFDLFHPEDVEKIRKHHLGMLNHQESNAIFEYRIKAKNGEYKWVETNASVITNDNEEAYMLQSSTRDISIRKELEKQQLKNIEREKELSLLRKNFVSMASHQFRTPLTVMRSNLDMLELQIERKGHADQALLQKVADRIRNEIADMVNLMDDILILGKLDANQTRLETEQVDVNELLRKLIRNHFNPLSDGRKLIFKQAKKELIIEADLNLINHAFSNVISNAEKYSEGKPAPEITIKKEKAWAVIHVKDYGIGIPQKDIDKLFQSFYRASNSTKYQGTGLGLVIVKQFVELNNGKVSVISEEGKGTEVTIKLPLLSNDCKK